MLLTYLRLKQIPVINSLVEERETAYLVLVYIWNYFYTSEHNPFLEPMLILSLLAYYFAQRGRTVNLVCTPDPSSQRMGFVKSCSGFIPSSQWIDCFKLQPCQFSGS